jgi:hypothetical protein
MTVDACDEKQSAFDRVRWMGLEGKEGKEGR